MADIAVPGNTGTAIFCILPKYIHPHPGKY